MIFAGLIAAIAWNLLTWWFGIPSSSSHTLLGGFMGAALAHAGAISENGMNVINYAKVIPTFLFIFLAPLDRNDHGVYNNGNHCQYLQRCQSL